MKLAIYPGTFDPITFGHVDLVTKGLKVVDKNYIFLDTFLMSCRILGRHLESWVLNEIKKIAKNKKKNYILAEFIQTKRNQKELKNCSDNHLQTRQQQQHSNNTNNNTENKQKVGFFLLYGFNTYLSGYHKIYVNLRPKIAAYGRQWPNLLQKYTIYGKSRCTEGSGQACR